MTATERIEIRITRADKAACEVRAKECGMSLSAWIKHRILTDAVKRKQKQLESVSPGGGGG